MSAMIKKPVAELEGAQLDWAVAKALGHKITERDWSTQDFSTDWSRGGPIIERERIKIEFDCGEWAAILFDDDAGEESPAWKRGQTPLIAAMRAFVASKLGDEVEVPA